MRSSRIGRVPCPLTVFGRLTVKRFILRNPFVQQVMEAAMTLSERGRSPAERGVGIIVLIIVTS